MGTGQRWEQKEGKISFSVTCVSLGIEHGSRAASFVLCIYLSTERERYESYGIGRYESSLLEETGLDGMG